VILFLDFFSSWGFSLIWFELLFIHYFYLFCCGFFSYDREEKRRDEKGIHCSSLGYGKLPTCRPSISLSFPIPNCPGFAKLIGFDCNSARRSISGPIYDTVVSCAAVWCCFLSRLEAKYSPSKPATRVPAKNAPTEDPIIIPLLTGQLTAFPVPVSAVRYEVAVAVSVVPVEFEWDCWLEKPKVVRLKGKELPLSSQHEVSCWLLQHQLELDPFQHGVNEYSSTWSRLLLD
jgi:hypothetical protein